MPLDPATCPTGHAEHELAPLLNDTVPASHLAGDADPAKTTNNPAKQGTHADMPNDEA